MPLPARLHRPGRTPTSPLTRLRRMFLGAALASLVQATVMIAGADAPVAVRALGAAAALVLCASWLSGARRGAFRRAADLVEVPALLVLMHIAPGSPFVPLFGLAFRSLYGGPRGAMARYALWVAALLLAHATRGAVEIRADLARALGLAIAPPLFQVLLAALRRLQASEQRLASLVQNSTDVVTVLGEDLVITWQAEPIRTVLGHDPADLSGTSLLDLVDEDDHAALHTFVDDAARQHGLVRTIPLHLRHADGGLREFEVVVSDRLGDPSVRGLVLNMRDATERSRLERELRHLAAEREHDALHDPLTGLANRRKLFQRLEAAIAAAVGEDRAVALLIIDLDGFKELNDTLGHQAGDRLLSEIGPRLAAGAPAADLVARLGGDEFAVVLGPGVTLTEAERTACAIRAIIDRPVALSGLTLRVRASVGIAMYPEHAPNLTALVQRADIAMYCAKSEGLGHSVYDPARDSSSTQRLALMGELPEAIESDELVVLYQPLIDFRSGAIAGAEALVRWQHPVHGLLGPDVLLPLVEQSGLMSLLTGRVLDRALAQRAAWSAAGLDLDVAVNLAAPNLIDIGFAAAVDALLREHGVPPRALTLEVTETIVAADPPRVIGVMGQLHALGVRLSLDDFGTGSSSLSFLRRLPVQELKIDKSFVLGMDGHAHDGAIVRMITRLGHDLGVSVVAEGIETAAVYEHLRAGGCDRGQGFLLGRPVPADELARLAAAEPAGRAAA
ncbi:EAL domain-containing protein [Baekduia soli]|uniref:EAL domain-containing protein n=1 Tax=Baekduia soli TaxID=496014 RepID=A0A5B8U0B4_9ACTN|nr:EAL domain-containing protein [Baekduia soli]QEC46449.1 EAL domain-containing protein [Baekduia soli]